LEETEIMNRASVQDFYETPISTYIGFVSDFDLEGGFFHLDRIEWISDEDEERINELGLSKENDMPGGFYIYNPASYPQTFDINENTEYMVLNRISPIGREPTYESLNMKEFLDYLETVRGGSARPFWIETKDGYVKSVKAQYLP
jgi:hypothetical protein